MADITLDENPESTWGATDEYKEAWNQKFGNVSPSGSASKADWVDFAVKNGLDADEAEAMTRADLIDLYGANTLYTGSPANATPSPGDSGTGPSPSAGDPTVRTATVH